MVSFRKFFSCARNGENRESKKEIKREVELLREDNYKLETSLDDYKLKLSVLEKEMSESHAKLAKADAAEEEIVRLKDEIDSLKEVTAKVYQYEQIINTYKKSLEEMTDLRLRMKQLEEKNVELDKKNFSMEDDLKKVNQLDAEVEKNVKDEKIVDDLEEKIDTEVKGEEKEAVEDRTNSTPTTSTTTTTTNVFGVLDSDDDEEKKNEYKNGVVIQLLDDDDDEEENADENAGIVEEASNEVDLYEPQPHQNNNNNNENNNGDENRGFYRDPRTGYIYKKITYVNHVINQPVIIYHNNND